MAQVVELHCRYACLPRKKPSLVGRPLIDLPGKPIGGPIRFVPVPPLHECLGDSVESGVDGRGTDALAVK